MAIASIQSGETILDLGSGAGFDCFLAARQTGLTGRVIGEDMTPEMISKARANAAKSVSCRAVSIRRRFAGRKFARGQSTSSGAGGTADVR
jgi:ubiquinone/menaquinone biosynthesis C-methylase UbiE